MLNKLKSLFGGDPERSPYDPYGNEALNVLYNLLFADVVYVFRKHAQAGAEEPWPTLLAAAPDYDALARIAADEDAESRVRALAYSRLSAAHRPVPKGTLLGTIVEMPMGKGLDALAAYADGRVRYLNHADRAAIVESGPPEIDTTVRALLAASEPVIRRIGPWDKRRLPPPKNPNARLTFLVSDGLYFGEGPVNVMSREPIAGSVIAAATELLVAVTQLPSQPAG